MASVSNITRRLTQLAIRPISTGRIGTGSMTTSIGSITNIPKQINIDVATSANNQHVRSFSSTDEGDATSKQWNKWQQSLLKKSDAPIIKKRGGKTQRKKEAAQSLSSQERLLDAGPGQFPPLRYSDEETERLLEEAYANIPHREGKRGTRRRKRMRTKFFEVRKARSIKKAEKLAHHFDRMEKRSLQVEGIKRMKELAKEVRVEDQEYQMAVLQKWAEINGVSASVGKTEVVEGSSDDVISVGEK